MKTIERINKKIRRLPESSQQEVLDFVEFIFSKSAKREAEINIEDWNKFSLNNAMRGLEDDIIPDYSISDLKEIYNK